jgi:succinate dehydrogenase / fumarate reductase cytochrome b subunit
VSEAATTTNALFDKAHRPFLLRKLHSLSGVVPVGAFMVFHLWTNAKALQGQARFDEAVADISHMPYLPLLEAGILLPLAFHALYGVKLALEGKPNVGRYTFTRNWMYTLQRTTGVVAFGFIVYHLAGYWWPKVAGKMATEQFYPALCADLSATSFGVPVAALVYVLGIAAASFHLANGLWGFCFSWGITVSRRSQRLAAVAFGLFGLVVFLLGANTAIYFATGSRLAALSSEAHADQRTCADMAAAPKLTSPE